MKKSRLATAAVAAVVVGTIGFSVPAFGASGYGAVNVEKTDNVVTIGNDALSRTFSIKDNKLKPGKIDNKLAGKDVELDPQGDSEEFVIQQLTKATRVEPDEGVLSSVMPGAMGARVVVSSTMGEDGVSAEAAIDGKAETYWCSNLNASGVSNESFVLDLGSAKSSRKLNTLRVTTRVQSTTARVASLIMRSITGTARNGSR